MLTENGASCDMGSQIGQREPACCGEAGRDDDTQPRARRRSLLPLLLRHSVTHSWHKRLRHIYYDQGRGRGESCHHWNELN